MMRPSLPNLKLVTKNAASTNFNPWRNKWVTHLCRRTLNSPSSLRGELFHLLHPRQNWRGYRLVVRVDGEDFRHVALAFHEEHGWAMLLPFLAHLVMQRDI